MFVLGFVSGRLAARVLAPSSEAQLALLSSMFFPPSGHFNAPLRSGYILLVGRHLAVGIVLNAVVVVVVVVVDVAVAVVAVVVVVVVVVVVELVRCCECVRTELA